MEAPRPARTLGRWASTTLRTSTTAAASPAWRASTASPRTRRSARAIDTLDNLEHRGAEGADAETGDGAGILTQIPDAFLRAEVDFALPPAGEYAVAVCMLPREADRREAAETVIERLVADGGQRVLGWRDVPVDEQVPGSGARPTMPVIRQLFIGAGEGDFERRLYGIRRRAERGLGDAVYFCSFSSRTMVLKGMLGAPQLPRFYKDLCDPRFASARWRSSTRASRPTRSRAGRSRTRSASSPTTARSTRCAGT